jgi:hypothetical protein
VRALGLAAAVGSAVADNSPDCKELDHKQAELLDKKVAVHLLDRKAPGYKRVEDCSWNSALANRPHVANRLYLQSVAAEDNFLERTQNWLRLKC